MKFKSIKSKLIFTTAILFTAVAILLSVVSAYTNYTSTLKTLEATMTEAAHVGSKVVQTQIAVIDKLMSEFATTKLFVTDTMLVQKVEYLEEKSKQYEKEYRCKLYFADGNGNNVQTDKDVSGEDFYISAKQGKPYLSKPITRYDGSLGFIYAYPVQNDAGAFSGVIYMEFAYEVLFDAVEEASIGKTGNSYIIDENGCIVMHSNIQLVEQRFSAAEASKTDSSQQALAALQKKATAGEQGFGEYEYGGEARVVAYAPIEGTSWSYFAAADKSEFMDGLSQALFLSVSACFAVAVISIIVMSALALKVSKPIESVANRVALLAQGNISQKVEEVNGRDEAARLTRSTAQTVGTLSVIINDISSTLSQLAAGNLTVKIDSSAYVGEFEPIKASLNNITSSLNDAMLQINKASEQVTDGAEQVSGASQALSQGATEQASSIEELAASINEISGKIDEVAQSAQDANAQTVQASSSLLACNDRMAELNTAMSVISAKSNQIGKIVKTIDEIAFQTNILALNAAVEAARAGAAGKGFAVVAGEVRNLAAKSAEAVKSTTVLIEDARTAVNNGARIADETGCALLEVVQGAQSVASAVGHITQASVEQSGAIKQITSGMDLISGVVQTNSATAQQSAAASEELSSQALMLKALVGKFKITDEFEEEPLSEDSLECAANSL